MKTNGPTYHGYRFPHEIISHAVWLYHRFCLSFRDVEDLLAQRSITVSYETIRQWCRKFGIEYARTLRQRRVRLGDTWHLDELFVTIQGQRQYLWRAVDQDGDVIDILVQPRRDQRAAERFFRKLLKGQERQPRRLVTDKPRSYEAGRRAIMPSVAHDTERYANHRAEVSHEPVRQARATNVRVQIRGSRATILVCTRSHPESLPNRTPLAAVSQPPPRTISLLPCLARGNVCLMNPEVSHKPSQPHSNDAKLTVPYRVHRAVSKLLIVRFNTYWFRPKNETIFLKLTIP